MLVVHPGLLNYVIESSATEFIVATEAGILYGNGKTLSKNKIFIPAPIQDETCAVVECAFMKLNTLEKLYLCLEHENLKSNFLIN